MLNVYINYPNPHISIHGMEGCPSIRQQHKVDQRIVRIDLASLSSELRRFSSKDYAFGSQAKTNDMWLEVDFGDLAFERAAVEYIRGLLAARYMPFVGIKVETHCSER